MNEQIKSMLDEASQFAHDKHFQHVKKLKHVSGKQFMLAQDTLQEKFAELLIIKCATIAMENENTFPGQSILATFNISIPQSNPLSVDDFMIKDKQ